MFKAGLGILHWFQNRPGGQASQRFKSRVDDRKWRQLPQAAPVLSSRGDGRFDPRSIWLTLRPQATT